jgi:uncharacterized protein (DUF433 family)
VTNGIISKAEDVMGGTTVFAGTRVPVETLIEYLQNGDSIDVFMADFPSVQRDQIVKFLESVRKEYLPKVSLK